MKIANIKYNYIVDGDGVCVSVWFQGCPHKCKGCHNPQTHSFKGGYEFNTEAVQKICNELEKPYIAGLTLSGGHPLESENIKECTALCRYIKLRYPNKNIWLYTGWLWEDIKDLEIVKYVDVIVDGKYIEEERNISLPFCGSQNQRVIDVNETLKNKILVLLAN